MAWVATGVAIAGVVLTATQMVIEQDTAHKAKLAQEAAERQAALNAKKQAQEALAQQSFLDKQTKLAKPPAYEPGGVATDPQSARGGGTFA